MVLFGYSVVVGLNTFQKSRVFSIDGWPWLDYIYCIAIKEERKKVLKIREYKEGMREGDAIDALHEGEHDAALAYTILSSPPFFLFFSS